MRVIYVYSSIVIGLFSASCAGKDVDSMVPRTILALYKGSAVEHLAYHPTHRFLELPLNYLGLRLTYWDIEKGLPDLKKFENLRGILTWFQHERMKDPNAYLKWAAKAIDLGYKFVLIGGTGATQNLEGQKTSLSYINLIFSKLGLRRELQWFKHEEMAEYKYSDKNLVHFEQPLKGKRAGFYHVRITSKRATPFLRARTFSHQHSELVVVTHKGGYAAEDYFLTRSERKNKETKDDEEVVKWQVNPFIFFEESFATKDLPKPDVTTIQGKRLLFCHINGDGWKNFTEIAIYTPDHLWSSEIIKKEVLEKYSHIPFTVGAIAGDIDDKWHGNEKSQKIFRDICALPNVMPASHTYSHPEDWSLVKRDASNPKSRTYTDKPYDLKNEILGATKYLNGFSTSQKEIKLIQWSGDALPPPEAFQHLKQEGLHNLNGGESRFDSEYNSYGYLSPFGREMGSGYQIYSPTSNERNYTDFWTGKFFGLRYLPHTLDNTETPIRIKPVNVYFNMYSGQKIASLNAIKMNLDHLKEEDVFPIHAHEYAAIVEGFYHTNIQKLDKKRWKILNRGANNTIRFDRGVLKKVDFDQSKGVIGQKHFQGSLYVALDEKETEPIIALKKNEDYFAPPSAKVPYLVTTNLKINDLQKASQNISYEAQGFGRGEWFWWVPDRGNYRVETIVEGQSDIYNILVANDNILKIRMKKSSLRPIRVKIAKQ